MSEHQKQIEATKVKVFEALQEFVNVTHPGEQLYIEDYVVCIASESMSDRNKTCFNFMASPDSAKYALRGLLDEGRQFYRTEFM